MLLSRRLQVQLLVLLLTVCLVFEQAQSYRIRTDKKAMRNSLIRFGKRAAVSHDDVPLAQSGASLFESGVGEEAVDGPRLMLYPMFGYRQNLY